MEPPPLPTPGSTLLLIPMGKFALEIKAAGKPVELSVESGKVIGVRKVSVTHVSGSVSNGSGNISSSVERKTEFAVVGTDGVERPHWFSDHSFFLRDGNRVSLIHACHKKERAWVCLVNHDTQEWRYIWEGANFCYELGLVRKFGWFWIIVIGLLPAWFGYTKNVSEGGLIVLAGMIAAPFILLKLNRHWHATGVWERDTAPHIERIRKQLLGATENIAWPQ